MRGPDTGALLGRALARSAEISGATVEVDSCDTRPWFSATLSGARHAVAITAPAGDAVTRWLRSLPEQSLPLSGHLVADLTVAQAVEHAGRLNLRIDALTVAAA